MLRKVLKATPLKNRILQLQYADGTSVKVDFRPIIGRGGVFDALNREEIFNAVAVGGNGRFVFWPGELDFCADALWMAGTSSAIADEQLAPKP